MACPKPLLRAIKIKMSVNQQFLFNVNMAKQGVEIDERLKISILPKAAKFCMTQKNRGCCGIQQPHKKEQKSIIVLLI